MDIGEQIAIRGHFEYFADVDDEGAGDGGRTNPLPVVFHFEAFLNVLEQYGHKAAVFVGTHPLVAFGGVTPRVADDFEQIMRIWRVNLLKNVFGLAQGNRKGLDEPDGQIGGGGLVAQNRFFEGGQAVWPLIGTTQTIPRSVGGDVGHYFALGADVDLLAPVTLTTSEFLALAIVAPEMG